MKSVHSLIQQKHQTSINQSFKIFFKREREKKRFNIMQTKPGGSCLKLKMKLF